MAQKRATTCSGFLSWQPWHASFQVPIYFCFPRKFTDRLEESFPVPVDPVLFPWFSLTHLRRIDDSGKPSSAIALLVAEKRWSAHLRDRIRIVFPGTGEFVQSVPRNFQAWYGQIEILARPRRCRRPRQAGPEHRAEQHSHASSSGVPLWKNVSPKFFPSEYSNSWRRLSVFVARRAILLFAGKLDNSTLAGKIASMDPIRNQHWFSAILKSLKVRDPGSDCLFRVYWKHWA